MLQSSLKSAWNLYTEKSAAKLLLPINGPGMSFLPRQWYRDSPKTCGKWVRIFPFDKVTCASCSFTRPNDSRDSINRVSHKMMSRYPTYLFLLITNNFLRWDFTSKPSVTWLTKRDDREFQPHGKILIMMKNSKASLIQKYGIPAFKTNFLCDKNSNQSKILLIMSKIELNVSTISHLWLKIVLNQQLWNTYFQS